MKFSDFNLRIGYPSSFDIEAGSASSRYLEVSHPNSLIYIGFATYSNDISFELLKYVNRNIKMSEQNYYRDAFEDESDVEDSQNDKNNFESILKLERIESSISPIKVRS